MVIIGIGKEVLKINGMYKHEDKLWAPVTKTFNPPDDMMVRISEYSTTTKLLIRNKMVLCSERRIHKRK